MRKLHVDNTDQDNVCVESSTCPPGTRFAFQSYQEASCPACPANTYQDQGNHRVASCREQTCCGPGFQLQGAGPMTPGVCVQCTPGTFQSRAQHFETQCTTAARCTGNQHELVASTATADTQCTSLSQCTDSQYEFKPPAAGKTDRICEAVRACPFGQYITTPHTQTSDRVCSYCDGIVQYSNTVNSNSCKDMSFCGQGEVVVVPGTAQSDLTCGPCDGAKEQYQSASRHRETACQKKKRCPAGTHVLKDDVQQGRLCTACTGGTFMHKDAHSEQQCLGHAVCGAGEYIAVKSSATNDRKCSVCDGVSQYSDESNLAKCKDMSFCGQGEVVVVPGTAQSDLTCGPCDGAKEQYQSASRHRETACQQKQTCPAGEYAAQNDAKVGRVCTACASRYYMDQAGHMQTQCIPATVCNSTQYETRRFVPKLQDRVCSALAVCSAAQYILVKATATSNRVCKALYVCTGKQYIHTPHTATSNRVCKLLSMCTGAQYIHTPHTASSDRICKALSVCDPRTQYRRTQHTANSDRVCGALTECGPGKFVEMPAAKAADRVCNYCNGTTHYSDEANLAACKAMTFCSYGQRVAVAGTASTDLQCASCNQTNDEFQGLSKHRATVCEKMRLCPAGAYVSTADMIRGRECTQCPSGRYIAAPQHAATACLPQPTCALGERLANASTVLPGVCAECRSGSFRPSLKYDQCTRQQLCQRNQYAQSDGNSTTDRVCAPCAAGQFMPRVNHTEARCDEPAPCVSSPGKNTSHKCFEPQQGSNSDHAGGMVGSANQSTASSEASAGSGAEMVPGVSNTDEAGRKTDDANDQGVPAAAVAIPVVLLVVFGILLFVAVAHRKVRIHARRCFVKSPPPTNN